MLNVVSPDLMMFNYVNFHANDVKNIIDFQKSQKVAKIAQNEPHEQPPAWHNRRPSGCARQASWSIREVSAVDRGRALNQPWTLPQSTKDNWNCHLVVPLVHPIVPSRTSFWVFLSPNQT